jgi:mono/diheme cytochrome c family protein
MRKLLVALVVVVAIAAAVTYALAYKPAIAAAATPVRTAFDDPTIVRGAELVAVGNCASCHTTETGMPFAGGVPLKTPFGTIHGTNITPDAKHGIGEWSEAAFVRAMREGVSRDGHLLYPAFPYTHFTHTTDADLHALYAFLMTRDAADTDAPGNSLLFPLQWRPLLVGWNMLYFRKPGEDDPVRALAASGRGAYLVESLAHCGACHSERNLLGAEKGDRRLAGNVIDAWYAPPLDARSPSPVPWTVDTLVEYLRTGLVADHAMAGGPMQTAVDGLSGAKPEDLVAIATYIVANMGPSTAEREKREQASRSRAEGPLAASSAAESHLAAGATAYATACARCHDAGRGETSNSGLRMPLAVALYDDDPHSFVRIVRDGIHPRASDTGRFMPAFANALSNDQLVALGDYLRQTAAGVQPWPTLESVVKENTR